MSTASSSSSSSSSASNPGSQSSSSGSSSSQASSSSSSNPTGNQSPADREFETSPQVAGSQGQQSTSANQGPGETGTISGDQSGNESTSGNAGFDNGGFESAGASGQQGGFENGQDSGAAGGQTGQGSGDDPFADLSSGRGEVMTAAERRAALDARLNEGFAEFDGMILGERERVQSQADEAGSDVMSGNGGGAGGGDQDGQAGGPLIIASAPEGSTGGGIMQAGNVSREGDFSNQQEETFPVPEDIPGGNNDDVVARQLREAAMREPDPELREKLWDEYRAYTGLGQE